MSCEGRKTGFKVGLHKLGKFSD